MATEKNWQPSIRKIYKNIEQPLQKHQRLTLIRIKLQVRKTSKTNAEHDHSNIYNYQNNYRNQSSFSCNFRIFWPRVFPNEEKNQPYDWQTKTKKTPSEAACII